MTQAIIRHLRRLWHDTRGASLVELTMTVPLLLLVTFILVEGSFALWQYNTAAKASQLGGRLAAVSDPVWQELTSITGTEGGASVGDPFPDFRAVCDGASQSCNQTAGPGNNPTYDSTAMDALVYGRGGDTTCGNVGVDAFIGMCDVFPTLTPANVQIEYENSGLGFAGRPMGPVPQITVRLTGLTYDFVAIGPLLNFFNPGTGQGSWTFPDFEVTTTGEDLGSAAP